jgi:membrane protein required for colicin V production
MSNSVGSVGLNGHRTTARLRPRSGVAGVLDLAIWAAWKFGPLVEPHLGGLLADPKRAPWVGRLVILVLVLLLGWVVGMLLSYFTRSIGLGPVDRVIGLLFGIVRGIVLVGLMIIGANCLHLNHEAVVDRSKLVPYGETVGDWLRAMVGEKGEPWAKLERLTGVKVKPSSPEVLHVRNRRNGRSERGQSAHL